MVKRMGGARTHEGLGAYGDGRYTCIIAKMGDFDSRHENTLEECLMFQKTIIRWAVKRKG